MHSIGIIPNNYIMKKILLFAAAALALLSCSKEDVAPQADLQAIDVQMPLFHATTETSPVTGTKVYADEDLKVLWNSSDSISIFQKATFYRLYRFTGNDGDTGGDFEYVSSQEPWSYQVLSHNYAVYPYSPQTSINSRGVVSLSLPSVQHYKENSFGIGANTMVAVTDDYSLQFKNVCGYLRIRLWGNNIEVKSIKLEANYSSNRIAGRATVTPVMDGNPSISMANNATNSITLVCDEPVALGSSSAEATDFIFVVPPTTISGGFKITVTDKNGADFEKKTSNSLTIVRNTMESMDPVEVIPDYESFVEFDDDIFEGYCLENFDTDTDGKINIREALAVEEFIDVRNKGISSMKGLEHFRNVERLYCDGNQISTLDVSQNTALRILYCGANQLSNLDISRNTALEVLECAANQLSRLVISYNPALWKLDCYKNQLTEIYIENNTSLKEIFCYENLLTSLDLTSCTGLTHLECSDNQINELDLSKNTALTSLSCPGNQLTSLDLSQNTALTELYCYENQLTSLDLSHNPDLEHIRCYGNSLTELDVSNNAPSMTLYGWPQTGTLLILWKKMAQTITYKAADASGVIVPANYGTTVIEVDRVFDYEDYKTISYDEFYYVNAGGTAFESRPGSVDENLDGTWAKLQKDRNSEGYYKLILFSGAASIEFHTGTSGTTDGMYVDKYPGYNDAISYDLSTKQAEFTVTVNGHTYLFQIRTSKCNIPTGTIVSGATLEIEGYVKKDGAWYPNGYNTYQMLTVD